MGEKVAFELESDVSRVEVNLLERDDALVLDSAYQTDDRAEIAALDAAGGVKRAEKKAKA